MVSVSSVLNDQALLFSSLTICESFPSLPNFSVVALNSYSRAVNVFLTGMFLYPLVRARIRNLHIRRVGQRAILAALVALSSSCINILVLTLLHGSELAWVCLGSCGLDVRRCFLLTLSRILLTP